nr:putative endosialidase [uncultured Mediterranean phage uvMED]
MTNARDKANIPVLNFQSKGIDDNADATAITINSSEQVGIGTASPDGILHLDDGATTKLIIEKDGGGAGSLIFHNDGSQTSYIQLDASEDMVHYGGSGVNQIFYASGSERMRLTSTGLGIGTSSPTEKLVVNGRIIIDGDGSGNNHGTLIIDGSATSSSQIRFYQNGTPKGYVTYWDSSDTLGLTDGSANGLHFSPSTQRVGIGTSSPGQKLDLVGNAEINGNIYNNGKLNIRKDGASESEHLVITNETGGSNASPTFTDIQFNGVSGKDKARIRVQDQSNNKVGGFMRLETSGGNTIDGSSFETRIFLDNDGDISFYEDTGTTPKVKWDATNERFGIGEIVPLGTLHVKSADSGASVNSGHNQVIAENSGNSGMTILSGTSSNGALCFGDSGNNCIGYINYAHNGNHLDFGVNNSERMRITSGGQIWMRTTSTSLTNATQVVFHPGSSEYGIRINSTGTSGTQYHLSFDRGQTQAGYITSNSATTIAVNNSSDERLKENIENSGSAIQDIKDLKVRQFDWKDNIDTHRDFGFVAQELHSIIPEAVSVGSDELDDNGKPKQSWGVDYSHIVPRLVKAVQEQQTRIESLEAEVTALKNQP